MQESQEIQTLMRAGILAGHPNLPENVIKEKMLARLYKNDFSESVLEEISKKLEI